MHTNIGSKKRLDSTATVASAVQGKDIQCKQGILPKVQALFFCVTITLKPASLEGSQAIPISSIPTPRSVHELVKLTRSRKEMHANCE